MMESGKEMIQMESQVSRDVMSIDTSGIQIEKRNIITYQTIYNNYDSKKFI